MADIDEQVYQDAGQSYAEALADRVTPDYAAEVMAGWPWWMRPEFRAAVGSAYRAGEQAYATRLRALVEQRMTVGAQIPTIPPGTPPTAVALWEWIRLLVDEAIR